MTYTQAVNKFRAVRADYDRLARLMKSPRTSIEFKTRNLAELVGLRDQTERARQYAISLKPD